MAWGYWSATTVDRGRSPRRATQSTPLPINLVQQEEEPTVTVTSASVVAVPPAAAAAAAASTAANANSNGPGNSNSMPRSQTPLMANSQAAGQNVNLCYSPTCRSRCMSPCPGSPCPGSPCGSITPPPPPSTMPPGLHSHPLTASQQCLHQHSNKNCPAAQHAALFAANDYPTRRQSLDRLDSPQVRLIVRTNLFQSILL